MEKHKEKLKLFKGDLVQTHDYIWNVIMKEELPKKKSKKEGL